MTKLAVLDHETSGLDPFLGESIELFVKIWDSAGGPDHGKTFHRLWIPQGEVDPGAAKVNGYTPDGWLARGARPMCPQDMIDFDSFMQATKPDMFAGAATHFDVAFLNTCYRRTRITPYRMTHRQFDVQSLALPFLLAGKITSVSLASLCAFFGVVNSAAHSAQGDVEATTAVIERMIVALWGSVQAFNGAT